MNTEAIEKSLNNFQDKCSNKMKELGYTAEVTQSIFSFIVEMRNMMIAVDNHNTHHLHIHMGYGCQALSNFATANRLKLSDCLTKKTYTELFVETEQYDFEHYLQIIKEDLDASTEIEMKDEDKIKYIQKGFVSMFPEDYFNDFLKIDRILSYHITNNL